MATRPTRAKKPNRPRVPLPRQQGGAHEDKTKRPHRERKHKKRDMGDDRQSGVTGLAGVLTPIG